MLELGESILMSLVKYLGIQMEIPLQDIVFAVTTLMTADFKAPLVSFSYKHVVPNVCHRHVRRLLSNLKYPGDFFSFFLLFCLLSFCVQGLSHS